MRNRDLLELTRRFTDQPDLHWHTIARWFDRGYMQRGPGWGRVPPATCARVLLHAHMRTLGYKAPTICRVHAAIPDPLSGPDVVRLTPAGAVIVGAADVSLPPGEELTVIDLAPIREAVMKGGRQLQLMEV